MKNREIAEIFSEIADLLEMQNVQWKPRAYREAARSLKALSEPIEGFTNKDELMEIDGIGESLAEKIHEFLQTGKIGYYEDLKKEMPANVNAITSI